METAAQMTFRITLPKADTHFLKRLSENMGWQVVRMPASKESAPRKVAMTEEEFRAKIVRARQQYAVGEVVTMQPNETSEDFIERICTR